MGVFLIIGGLWPIWEVSSATDHDPAGRAVPGLEMAKIALDQLRINCLNNCCSKVPSRIGEMWL